MSKKAGILKYTESLIIIIIWMAVAAAPLFVFQIDSSIQWENVFFAWFGLIPFFILYCINHFLLVPCLLFKDKKILYLISAMVLAIIFSISLFMIEGIRLKDGPPPYENFKQEQLSKPKDLGPRDRPPPFKPEGRNPIHLPPLVNTFIISILIIGFDTGLRMMVRWSTLEQEKTLLEKENVQNQLAFLRNQVSPHFFMNTLNNIHALIDVNTEEAKESIIKLSKLMRHLLYDSQAELVPLSKELEFIQSYIKLMKLRFSDKVKINLSLPNLLPDKSIPPLLFTSFVENAFKHGISYQSSTFIDISFLYENESLIFEIKNSNPGNGKETEASGIGIENSKKRLDIIYGKDYSLDIEDNKEDYKLILKIPV